MTIVTDKKELARQLLDSMYKSICTQKELLELLLKEYEAAKNSHAQETDEPRELIKGIKGLANFLGCSQTKAQDIMNSGILQAKDIAYRAGNRWRFNKALLDKLLHEQPEILYAS